MLLDALVISLIVALLRGGKLRRLAELPLKRVELIVLAFLIQFLLSWGGERGVVFLSKWGIYLYIGSYILLLIAIWYNRDIKEMIIFGMGITFNFLAILANGGQMPVSISALNRTGMMDVLPLLKSKTYVLHSLLNEGTKLKFLTDIIPLPSPYPRPRVLSVGDIIMALGIFFLIQHSMVKRRGTRDEGQMRECVEEAKG